MNRVIKRNWYLFWVNKDVIIAGSVLIIIYYVNELEYINLTNVVNEKFSLLIFIFYFGDVEKVSCLFNFFFKKKVLIERIFVIIKNMERYFLFFLILYIWKYICVCGYYLEKKGISGMKRRKEGWELVGGDYENALII